MSERGALEQELRTPRAAAVAGIAFSVILTTVVVLMHSASAHPGSDPSIWISDASQRHNVSLSLTLIPFAGITFLWFIGVIRSRLGVLEDKLFATVFLGSGILFVGMLFSAAAVMGGLLTLYSQPGGVSGDTVRWSGALTSMLLATFGARMAAVFTLAVTNVARRAKLIPRWLTVFGYLCALALLLVSPGASGVQLLFPAWVLVLSIYILVESFRAPGGREANRWAEPEPA
ncbi:MAG: hypothetical protein WAN48_13695 [Actinomycetes bacterium]